MANPFHFGRKRQTAVKGRSSALVVSIAIHLAIFLVAGTFVAVTVVKKEEPKFEGKQIARPKMKLKKLQVPVKIEKKMKRQAPKLSQRVTAVKVNSKSVDFKMPEVSGLGGGLGVNLSDAGFSGSLGFASTQINVFGLKSTGEKILFILDTNRNMLIDEIGGIPAYKIIKNELISLIQTLPPTTLFNVVVSERSGAQAFSPELTTATDATIKKLKQWLAPLNSGKERFGLSTLAYPGTPLEFERMAPIYNIQRDWWEGLTYGLQKGVDNIYFLGTDDYIWWIHKDLLAECKRGKPLKYLSGYPPECVGLDLEPYGKERWEKLLAKAKKMFEEENAKRKARGEPLRVIPLSGSDISLVQMYFPGTPVPQYKSRAQGVVYYYTMEEQLEYIENMQKKYAAQNRRSAQIGLKNKKLSFNVIHFVPANKPPSPLHTLDRLAKKMNGDCIQIQGLEAIESAATAKNTD